MLDADPIQEKREKAQKVYGLEETRCFESAEEMFKQPRLADAVVIATRPTACRAGDQSIEFRISCVM